MLSYLYTMFPILSYSFTQIAFVATLLITLMCGFLSPVVVLKQRSYLSDTLAHLVFPGVVLGIVLAKLTTLPLWGCIFVGAFVSALVGTFISEWILKTLKIPPDSSAVLCLTSFFAAGIVVISLNRNARINPESILFGDVLTLTWREVGVLAFALCVVCFAILILRKHWDAWLCDSQFAELAGFKVKILNYLFPFLLCFAILSGIFAVGGLMISALITLPTLIYQPRSVFSPMVIILSAVCGFIGFMIAFSFNWPVGPSVVLVGFSIVVCKTIIISALSKTSPIRIN